MHQVVIAHRCAAERNQHIGFGVARAADGCVCCAQLIDSNAEINGDASVGIDESGDGEIVGGDDLRRPKRSTWRDQFVAGRQNCDPGAPVDR